MANFSNLVMIGMLEIGGKVECSPKIVVARRSWLSQTCYGKSGYDRGTLNCSPSRYRRPLNPDNLACIAGCSRAQHPDDVNCTSRHSRHQALFEIVVLFAWSSRPEDYQCQGDYQQLGVVDADRCQRDYQRVEPLLPTTRKVGRSSVAFRERGPLANMLGPTIGLSNETLEERLWNRTFK